ncbi:MAG: hypothetical protein KF752_07765 [Pirellulaceae bacterium]|nr:hypothetical protein [Pirellulaceae bacterium]
MSNFDSRQTDCTAADNPAHLIETKEAYSDLVEQLSHLRQTAANGVPLSIDANQWVAQLAEFRQRLAQQFSAEGSYGYMSQTAGQEPSPQFDDAQDLDYSVADDARQPAGLRNQHAELYVQLSELCELVEEAQYRGTIIRDFPIYAGALQQFEESLRSHEALLAELIAHRAGRTDPTC